MVAESDNLIDETVTSASETTPERTAGPLSGKLGVFISIVLIGSAGLVAYRHLFGEPTPDPPPVTYMCSETEKTFRHVIKTGEIVPVMSPYTKKKTGYPTEQCYCWTKGGKRKDKPTYVILNEHLGKNGPTTCPSCGLMVYPHNTDYYSSRSTKKN